MALPGTARLPGVPASTGIEDQYLDSGDRLLSYDHTQHAIPYHPPSLSPTKIMEGQEYLTEYRNISNKLKKRFLRRPNVSEASEQFRGLAKRLEDNEEPQYAAYCHLATGKNLQ